MKSQRNILIAFILNLCFSVFEFIGGLFTGSFAILSDSLHDMGDAMSIGVAFILEKKSHKKPDDKYTYGYSRYSVIGSVITTLILLLGSVSIIYNAIFRIISPTDINYKGMIVLAVIGVVINLVAAFFTKNGDSLNQKAVNLHMLEDVMGWLVVLIGAVVMKFTDIKIIDPILSIGVALFVLINAVRNLKEALELFLEKTPKGMDVSKLREHLCKINGVSDVHHIHLWSIDGTNNFATMHLVTEGDAIRVKKLVREELKEHGISHVTLEIESPFEDCCEKQCRVCKQENHRGHHHHHHH
ncbi:MAG: cation transporter [Ruminococcus sp.]|nr:cation transporter [Ruminococcus sp.]